jgi:hypothetical protein
LPSNATKKGANQLRKILLAKIIAVRTPVWFIPTVTMLPGKGALSCVGLGERVGQLCQLLDIVSPLGGSPARLTFSLSSVVAAGVGKREFTAVLWSIH